MADILASVSVVLGAEVSAFRAAMAQANKDLKGLAQTGEAMKDIGTSLTKAVSVPLALLGAGAVTASAKLDSLKRGLQAIAQQELGKQGVTGLVAVQQAAQQTGERIKVLQDIAKQPGLGFETAEQADIRLRAVGISAEQSAKSIKAFANAIATTGGGTAEFGTVTTQLSQLGAKGKVLAQDLRPIIEAAPAVAAALQTLYGTVDSEEISKSLAKQGQSSKDFIRILTDELAKLPQVTGGLKAVYENDMDALLVASAKVGDGIAKAFNLEAVGERLGDQIMALGDGFANLSAPTQAAIVTFAGLAAATGPVLVGLGTIGAALPAIKAGFVAVQGAATLLTTSLQAGFVALLNPVTIVIAALGAFAVAAYRIETAGTRALESYREQAAATRKLTADVSPLLDRYDELRAKTSLNAAEQAELKAIVEKVTAVMPAAGQGIDGYGKYIGLATEKARDFIKGNQGLEKAIALQSLPAQRQKLLELTEAYDRLLQERDQLNRGAFNGVKVDDLGTQFLVDFQKELGTTATELEKQTRLVAELGTAAGITATQYDALGATFPTLAANLAKLGSAFPIPNFAGNPADITAQVGLLKGLHDQLKQLKEDQQNAGTELAALSFNPQIKSLQEYIAKLEGADKSSKKSTDAIKKLREELARLTVLDNLLGDTPSQLEVLERRSDTLLKGLKTLVDAGVSPSSRAFKSFALEAANLGQQIDQLKAIGGTLDLKPVSVKSLIPQTIGDTLPQDVARLLGDYAKQAKPFELPLQAKITIQGTVSLADQMRGALQGELENVGRGFREISAAADIFGGSFDAAAARIDVTRQALQNLVSQGFTVVSPQIKQLSDDLQNQVALYDVNRAATDALTGGLSNLASGFLEGIGQLATGSITLEQFGSTVLGLVGKLATQLGEAIIAVGIGLLHLKTAFTNPFAAIAAGAALVVVGAALSGIASSAVNSGGGKPSVSSAVPSAPRNFTPTTAPGAAAQGGATYTHKVEITASGRNLAGVLTLDTDRLGRVIGTR
jgi:tape measure domain-containing protein